MRKGSVYKVMLGVVLFLSVIIINISNAIGATFTVTNTTEFQDALDIAHNNNEDDIIYVSPGTYIVSSTLSYQTDTGDNGHSLIIKAQDMNNKPVLNGNLTQIMNINTDTSNNGGDMGGDITICGIVFKNGSNSFGGGIYIHTTSASINVCKNVFDNNSASNGGGIYVKTDSGNVTVTDNIFSKNSGSISGGGICVQVNSSTVNFENNTFNENGDFLGGGIYMEARTGKITLINNTFFNNSGGVGAGACIGSTAGTIILINNIFAKNVASFDWDSYGGGVHAETGSGKIIFTNNIFNNNSANYGGGINIMLSDDQAKANIYNNIFWNNAADSGEDIYIMSDKNGNDIGSIINLYNNNLSGNADFETGQSEDLFITETDNYSHGGNIQENPLFVDAENGDFHLQSTSPCIDTGTNDAPHLPETDKDGKPRIIDGNGDDIATVDMGPYEFGDICEGDFDYDGDVDGSDLATFAADFGRTDCSGDCEGDFDNDGDVDGSDLAVFAADFGRTDCPCWKKVR
ncbi:Right handed beta helix region [Candidatus Methanoperedenaceae archaeon GB37]|nr:Right handed beta helix region [Candidatus Methanoperedenaceae archaeon GB37]